MTVINVEDVLIASGRATDMTDAGLAKVETFPVWYERNPPRGVEDYRMVFGIGRKVVKR